ncbi:MAG: TonB-dependent receptor plug domain-containing protein, partial [Bacteroidota bacterium]
MRKSKIYNHFSNRKSNLLLSLVFVTLITSLSAIGQSDTFELPAIPITASRISVESRRINQAVTTLTEDILLKGQARTSLQDYAAYVPGVLAQNAENYAQDVRISIRGFGSRSAFGI